MSGKCLTVGHKYGLLRAAANTAGHYAPAFVKLSAQSVIEAALFAQ